MQHSSPSIIYCKHIHTPTEVTSYYRFYYSYTHVFCNRTRKQRSTVPIKMSNMLALHRTSGTGRAKTISVTFAQFYEIWEKLSHLIQRDVYLCPEIVTDIKCLEILFLKTFSQSICTASFIIGYKLFKRLNSYLGNNVLDIWIKINKTKLLLVIQIQVHIRLVVTV